MWFIAPNKALSEQQYNVLQQRLPAYHVRLLTGADKVDKWTDQTLWDAFLAGVHVVVGTPAVLGDALTHGFVTMSRLSLCVFDESHRCVKNDPMNKIMRDFYHPAKLKGNPVPNVMALSASPVMNSNANQTGLRTIECNLNSMTVTPKQFRRDMETHSHIPALITVVYDEGTLRSDSPAFDTLILEVQSYDIDQDPYVLVLREQNDANAYRRLLKVFDKGKTYCTEQLRSLLSRATHVGEQLGTSMAEWLVCTSVRRFLDSNDFGSSLILDLETREKRHLKSILMRVISSTTKNKTSIPDIVRASDKAKALHDILRDSTTQSSRTIVFVEQRAMVVALAHLLGASDVSRSGAIATFVGTSSFADRKTSLGDLIEHKAQSQDLQDFRNGTKNLMIATNVLEEGMDVPACNGVICFDLPKNLISFVQRRGRARETKSMYILFVALNDPHNDPARWQELENKMKEAYMDDTRAFKHLSEAEGTGDDDISSIQYMVPSTGALLTLDNASSHLHHFCATSTLDARYVDPRPEFDAKNDPVTKTWTASVTLPSFVHTSLRSAESAHTWGEEQAAIKDAAFNAYVALHKAGLVNDNLLPAVKDPGPETEQQHVDQPSLVQVSEQLSAWSACSGTATTQRNPWYAAEIKLSLCDRELVSQIIWLPFATEAAERIQLYWNSDTFYEVTISPITCEPLNDHDRDEAAAWTSLVLRSVNANRMTNGEESAFLLSAPSRHTHHDMSGAYVGDEVIRQRLSDSKLTEYGLVSVADQPGKTHILHEIHESTMEESANNHPWEAQLVATAFPKRRDFLHRPPEGNETAYTSRQSFPLSQCTVGRLPFCYSLLAVFLPSVIHRVDTAYIARLLSATILGPVGIDNTAQVLEAICAPAASEPIGDYNRLEYLGDSILKFCTELQVVAQHPTWPEAFLSAEKDRIVRNSNLAKASLQAGLDRFIITKSFTGSKWRPSHLHDLMEQPPGLREMSSKVLADVVEALIGAAYVDGGLPKAYKCILTLLPDEVWWNFDLHFDVLSDGANCVEIPSLSHLEELIGHRFQRPTLLLEAITHASYPNSRTSLSYERLEFLGDAVLDLIITPKLHAHARKLRHWDLHRVHEALVNGRFLGFCCMSLRGEQEKYDIVNTSSNGVPRMQPHGNTWTYYLYDFIRASGQVALAKQQSILRFDSLCDRIATALQNGSLYPWPDLTTLQPEKFFSDIVESILGAIYIDARGDLGACERFLEKLGILPMMRAILDRNVDTTFPKERVGLLADREEVKYVVRRAEGDEGGWTCAVLVDTREVADSGRCDTREEAEVRAADAAASELAVAMEEGVKSRKRKLNISNKDDAPDAEMMDVSGG